MRKRGHRRAPSEFFLCFFLLLQLSMAFVRDSQGSNVDELLVRLHGWPLERALLLCGEFEQRKNAGKG